MKWWWDRDDIISENNTLTLMMKKRLLKWFNGIKDNYDIKTYKINKTDTITIVKEKKNDR